MRSSDRLVDRRWVERHKEYRRRQGLAGYVDCGPTQERIRYLHDRLGLTFEKIAGKTGLTAETVGMHYRGIYKNGPAYRSVRMATERIVLKARFAPDESEWFPAVGIRRRLQALSALGFTGPFLADRLPVGSFKILHAVIAGDKSKGVVRSEFATAVIELYDRWYNTDPATVGVGPAPAARCRTISRQRGYVLPGCWDPDTIDDPDALPEWTGACGTERGYQVHWREKIPYCTPCREAHYQYKLDHPGTSVKNRAPEVQELLADGRSKEYIIQELGVCERTVARAMKKEAA